MPGLPFPQAFLSRLDTLRLRTRRRMLGSRPGIHASPRPGTSLEFSDYRSYTPGDDPRRVDWPLYARTDRLHVRVYEEEEDLFVYLLVDATASMATPPADRKYERASGLALALAYVALSSGDAVRCHRLGSGSRATAFVRGRHGLFRLQEFLETGPAGGRRSLRDGVADALATLRRPGKAILVSDLLRPHEDVEAALHLLRAANLDVAFLQVLGASDLDPPVFGAMRLVDAEDGRERAVAFDEAGRTTYLENLERHRTGIRGLCHRAGFAYALHDTRRDLEAFVLAELPALGLLRG